MRKYKLLTALALLLLAPAALSAQRILNTAEADSLRRWSGALQPELSGVRLDPLTIVQGGRLIPAGMRVRSDVGSYRGDLDIHGEIIGNAIAFGADVVLREGAHVDGDVIAVGGRVRQEGGTATGEIRAVTGYEKGIEALFAAPAGTVRGSGELLSLVAGWFAVLAAVAVAVLLLARNNLAMIAERIRFDFGRSLIVGVAAQLGLFPAMLLLVIALAITIVGILLIPFALVALLLGVIGLTMLGFLAMAYNSGRSVRRRAGSGAAEGVGEVTTHLMLGLALYFVLWALAALASPLGMGGALLRAMAVIVTWVAMTVGFGAALLSRGGTRAPAAQAAAEPEEDDYSWQTPTPVSGVTAARRPTPAPRTQQEWK